MRFTLVFFIFLMGVTVPVFAQESCEVIRKTELLIQRQHIQPATYNMAAYHEILDLYIGSIDSEGLIFSLADSSFLHQKITKALSLCEVYRFTKEHVLKRIKSHDSLVKALDLAYLTNNNLKETFNLPCYNSSIRQVNQQALQAYDKKYYKYLFIEKNHLLKEAAVTLEPQKVLNSIIQKRTTYLSDFITDEKALLNAYLKAVVFRNDPHSVFLDANEKQQWMTQLSKEELSFGFEIEITENELYKVKEMIPGGAAWNSKQIEVGDFIEQIELESGKKYLVGIDSDHDFYEAFQSKVNKTLTFYLSKPDGTKVKTKLTKGKVEVFDNVINGYIFQKDNHKLGYIDLPSFYSAENPYGGGGCASDLAREILQLKKDSIEGLIIDLRGNGGGYMHEALSIAGLFIDEGILALKQEKGDKPRYLKDPNRGTLYDGKLIILVNSYSASASELLAGTLQQYNRAIIVGNRTYGKATMQVFLPIDTAAERKNTNDYYVNVTMGKFYMVNKKTHQAIGIQPDIYLPSMHDYMKVESESTSLYYLKPDSIVKTVELTLFPNLNLGKIKQQSEERVKSGDWVTKFKAIADTLNYYQCNPKPVGLNQSAIFTWEDARDKFLKAQEQTNPVAFTAYPISNTSLYNRFLKEHEMYMKPNEFKKAELRKDIRLHEALNILSDYIRQP